MVARSRKSSSFQDQTTPMRSGDAPLLPVVLQPMGSPSAEPFRLAAGSCFVGSSPGAHLVLNDRTVSRQHCEVELCAGGVRVTDLDSRNGTFYLGQRVDAIVLAIGSSFTVGAVTVSILPDTDSRRVEPSSDTSLGTMLGESLAMRRLFAIVTRMQDSAIPVLLEGEAGVGKETLARTIHSLSKFSAGPFTVLRCAAVPRDLIAAELFGDGQGTGGVFAGAQGGTSYLADVDAIPQELQLALLERLERTENGSARLITSSTAPLEDLVREGRFASELYFRISVVRLSVPPLRERREDIAALARSFVQRDGRELSPAAIEDLKQRSFPGNLRELESLILAYSALGSLPAPSRVRGSLLDLAMDEMIDPSRPYAELKDGIVDRFTARYLKEVLRHAAGNQSVAARLAGMDRTYFGRLLAKYQVR
jgi:DNA-binding NtrC family response regulator